MTIPGPVRAMALLVPVIICVLFVHFFGTPVPLKDDMYPAYFIGKYFNGTLTFNDLFLPHAEHRQIIPRAAMLTLGLLTGLNYKAFLYLGLLLALALAGLMICIFRANIPERPSFIYVFLAASLVLCVGQVEPLTWASASVVFFMSTFFFAAAVYSGAKSQGPDLWLIASLIFAALSSYSLASGLISWPLLLWMALTGKQDRKKRYSASALIALTGAAVLLTYFPGAYFGFDPRSGTALSSVMIDFLALLGGTYSHANLSAVLGGYFLICYLAVLLRSARYPSDTVNRIAASFSLFAVLSAAGIAASRVYALDHFGLDSRYLVLSYLGICGLMLYSSRETASGRPALLWKVTAAAAFIVLSVSSFSAPELVRKDMQERRLALIILVHEELFPDSTVSQVAYPAEVVRIVSGTMKEKHLSIFAGKGLKGTDLLNIDLNSI